MSALRIILLGPPGVGKGTQADLLSEQFKIPKISTGDILRKAIQNQTALGKIAQETIGQGKLVSDDVVIGIIQERFSHPDCIAGFILDGFPRTLVQAKALEKITPVDHVVSLVVDRDDIVKRLEGRWTCKNCQKMYHIEFQPPKKIGICDVCKGELYQRKDDQREAIEKRLSEYERLTEPLLGYYSNQRILKKIQGMGSVQNVFQYILDKIKG